MKIYILLITILTISCSNNVYYKYEKGFNLYLKKTFNTNLIKLKTDTIVFIPVDGCSCIINKNISILNKMTKYKTLIIGGRTKNKIINKIVDDLLKEGANVLLDSNSKYDNFQINMFEPNKLIIKKENIIQEFY